MTFPSIPATAWNVVPGSFPATESRTMDGRIATMRHSRNEVGGTWQAEFTVTRDQLYQILEHHQGQLSGLMPFQFTSTTLHPGHTPAGYEWRYAGEPSFGDQTNNFFTGSITFECVPIEPTAVIQGGRATILIRPAEAGYIPIINTDWANVQLLLPVNGSDGSTVITDESQYVRTVTTNNGKISSALKFFGRNTLTTDQINSVNLCTIAGVYTTTAPSVFTLEGWFFLAGAAPTGYTDALFIFGATEAAGRMTVVVQNGVIKLEQYTSGIWLTSTGYAPYNTPFHFAVVGKADDTVELILNGASIGSAARPAGGFGNGDAIKVAGRKGSYCGHIRYSTATVYTAPFTPRLAPFAED